MFAFDGREDALYVSDVCSGLGLCQRQTAMDVTRVPARARFSTYGGSRHTERSVLIWTFLSDTLARTLRP